MKDYGGGNGPRLRTGRAGYGPTVGQSCDESDCIAKGDTAHDQYHCPARQARYEYRKTPEGKQELLDEIERRRR